MTAIKKVTSLALATGFGLGYSPWAPGTVGSLPGFLLVLIEKQIPSLGYSLLWILIWIPLGIFIANAALPYFNSKDPRTITIDEIVSLPVTFFAIPLTWKTLIIGFVLNRIMDIWKPPPARQLEQLPGGRGIVMDDIAAGVYANLLLHGILWTGLI